MRRFWIWWYRALYALLGVWGISMLRVDSGFFRGYAIGIYMTFKRFLIELSDSIAEQINLIAPMIVQYSGRIG